MSVSIAFVSVNVVKEICTGQVQRCCTPVHALPTCLHCFLISLANCFIAIRFGTSETPRDLPFGLLYGCLMIKV